MTSPADIVAQLPTLGVGLTSVTGHFHIVDRRKGKTLCGRTPLQLYGIELHSRRQISCLRCYRLGFASVNAKASHIPDTPILRRGES